MTCSKMVASTDTTTHQGPAPCSHHAGAHSKAEAEAEPSLAQLLLQRPDPVLALIDLVEGATPFLEQLTIGDIHALEDTSRGWRAFTPAQRGIRSLDDCLDLPASACQYRAAYGPRARACLYTSELWTTYASQRDLRYCARHERFHAGEKAVVCGEHCEVWRDRTTGRLRYLCLTCSGRTRLGTPEAYSREGLERDAKGIPYLN